MPAPREEVAQRLVGRTVHRMLGSVSGLRVMGLGYAVPYLGPVRHAAERTLAFMPATQGVTNWPVAAARPRARRPTSMMPCPIPPSTTGCS